MKKRHISVGPGTPSLILIIVALAMIMLAAMTLLSAREDVRLTNRSAETAEEVYALYERAECSFAELDAAIQNETELPEGMTLSEDGKTVTWTEQVDTHMLECTAEICTENGKNTLVWRAQKLISGVENIWNDW